MQRRLIAMLVLSQALSALKMLLTLVCRVLPKVQRRTTQMMMKRARQMRQSRTGYTLRWLAFVSLSSLDTNGPLPQLVSGTKASIGSNSVIFCVTRNLFDPITRRSDPVAQRNGPKRIDWLRFAIRMSAAGLVCAVLRATAETTLQLYFKK